MGKTQFDNLLEKKLTEGTTMPRVKLGPHKHLRTIIPRSERIVRRFDIDVQSDLEMSAIALRRGYTVDELYRYVIWTYLEQG